MPHASHHTPFARATRDKYANAIFAAALRLCRAIDLFRHIVIIGPDRHCTTKKGADDAALH